MLTTRFVPIPLYAALLFSSAASMANEDPYSPMQIECEASPLYLAITEVATVDCQITASINMAELDVTIATEQGLLLVAGDASQRFVNLALGDAVSMSFEVELDQMGSPRFVISGTTKDVNDKVLNAAAEIRFNPSSSEIY